MTPPKQSSEPLDSSYGQYTGNQTYDQQQYAPPFASPSPAFDDDFADAVAQRVVQRLKMEEPGGKIHPQQTPDKNVLRIIMAIISMLLFFPFAFFFLIMIGGVSGLVGFCIVGFTIFVTVLVVLDKIK